MTPKSKIDMASEKARIIDETIQETLSKQQTQSRRAFFWGAICFGLLFVIGIVGIYYQNTLASESKQHIDCIIKDLSTPPPPGTSPNARKYIDVRSNLTSDCNIKFTQ